VTHRRKEIRPGIERQRCENVAAGKWCSKAERWPRPAGWFAAVQMAKEVAFPITGHAVAKDKVVHSAADVNWVQLNEAMVCERSSKVRRRDIEENRAPMKAPSIERRETECDRHDNHVKGAEGRNGEQTKKLIAVPRRGQHIGNSAVWSV